MASNVLLKFDDSYHAGTLATDPTNFLVDFGEFGMPSLATRNDATVEVAKANVPQVFFQVVLVICPVWAHISTANAAAQE